MARSVFLGIASACIALAVTATLATPSSAMSFSDYDNSSAALSLCRSARRNPSGPRPLAELWRQQFPTRTSAPSLVDPPFL